MKLVVGYVFMAVALLILLFLLCSLGHCAIPLGTPGDTVCKAELDTAACAKFQDILSKRGMLVKVIEGAAFGTVSDLKKKNYVVVLKCVNTEKFIVVVSLAVKSNSKVMLINVEFTSERQLPI